MRMQVNKTSLAYCNRLYKYSAQQWTSLDQRPSQKQDFLSKSSAYISMWRLLILRDDLKLGWSIGIAVSQNLPAVQTVHFVQPLNASRTQRAERKQHPAKANKINPLWGGDLLPVIVEPVDHGAGFQVELRSQFLNGFWWWVWLLLVGSFQSFLLFWCQHHPGLLQLVLWLWAGTLAVVDSSGGGLTRLTVAHRAVSPLHVGWKRGTWDQPRLNTNAKSMNVQAAG